MYYDNMHELTNRYGSKISYCGDLHQIWPGTEERIKKLKEQLERI